MTMFLAMFSTPTAGSCQHSASPQRTKEYKGKTSHTRELDRKQMMMAIELSTPTTSGSHSCSSSRGSCSTYRTTCGRRLKTRRCGRSHQDCVGRHSTQMEEE